MSHFSNQVKTFQDPLQFAYCPGVGAEDSIINLLQRAHSHLDKAGSTVRIKFLISPVLLIKFSLSCENLQKIQMDAPRTAWIIDYLRNRPQLVRVKTVCLRGLSAAQEHHRGL